MIAQESLRQGRLDEALADLQAQVREEPEEPRHRVFLFQLLAVLGRGDRALAQLEAAGALDAAALPMVHTYRPALAAEEVRAAVFAGLERPAVLGPAPGWSDALVEALRLTAAGEHGRAGELRAQALEGAPAVAGSIDGVGFAWIADADARLGPMLEVVVGGRYGWLPFQRLRAMRVEPPSDLRDLVWLAARLTLDDGAELVALVPTRYPGVEASDDPSLQLCRRTSWTELGAGSGCWAGSGQRLLATDAGEYPLLHVRELQLGARHG
jgi:type VI secretion system protein ImpE